MAVMEMNYNTRVLEAWLGAFGCSILFQEFFLPSFSWGA